MLRIGQVVRSPLLDDFPGAAKIGISVMLRRSARVALMGWPGQPNWVGRNFLTIRLLSKNKKITMLISTF